MLDFLLETMNSTINSHNNTSNINSTAGPIPNPVPIPSSQPSISSSIFQSLPQIVSYAVETLSIFGCILVFSIYIFNVKARNFSLRLLVYLAILFLFQGALNFTNDILQDYSILQNSKTCKIIGLTQEILNLSTMILIISISWFMKKAALNKLDQSQKHEKILLSLAIFIPTAITLAIE